MSTTGNWASIDIGSQMMGEWLTHRLIERMMIPCQPGKKEYINEKR